MSVLVFSPVEAGETERPKAAKPVAEDALKDPMTLSRRLLGTIGHLASCILVAAPIGCAPTPVANQDPVGRPFPDVAGEALDGTKWRIPGDLAGKPAILLVGYVQDAQFDIDRWLLGITQIGTPVPFLELPTIKGLAPRMFKGYIDDGMRSGIPNEDWRGVVTLWTGDAASVVELTGNEQPANARVLLLDPDGRIAWFTDRGYSASQMVALDAKARELLGGSTAGAESEAATP